jgi:DNA-directed RNA polymerase specialized sigma24 family protein
MKSPMIAADATDRFSRFVVELEPRLRRALVALCGPEDGRDATAEALGYAWANWERVEAMANPAGYLYRVGASRGRRRRRQPQLPPVAPARLPEIDPGLPAALARLSARQRVVVVLVHAEGWTQREVADLLELSPSSVANHLDRALARLRSILKETDDA